MLFGDVEDVEFTEAELLVGVVALVDAEPEDAVVVLPAAPLAPVYDVTPEPADPVPPAVERFAIAEQLASIRIPV